MDLPIFLEKINQIEDRLKKESNNFLDLFPDEIKSKIQNKFFLAGGCIYSLYNNKEPNDYDIFLYDSETKNLLILYFNKYVTAFKHGGISIGEYDGLKLLKTRYAISIGKKYQIIHKYIGKPNDVVSEFDFKHNMFYYVPHLNVVCPHKKSYPKYLMTNEIFFNDLRCRDLCNVIMRIPKFIERGMTIKKKEIAKILKKLQTTIGDDNEKEILLDYLSTQGY